MRRFACAFVLAVAALPARAEPLTAIETIALSTKLYYEGMARGDALLVLAAADLRKPVAFQWTDRAGAEQLAGMHEPLGWQEMLDEAEALAGEDAAILGQIDDLRAETGKGMASGPLYNIANLERGGVDNYPAAEFRGGDYAEAYVEAAADTDLNLTIHDASGNLVCEDRNPSPIAYCAWQPAETGSYVLTVENLGPMDATYSLMTN